jgi:dipeptidyl aminopeptidase/acylaminoacyl peptidase
MARGAYTLVVLVACAAFISSLGVQAKRDDLPRLQGAALLLGYPPASLIVTTPTETLKLQESRDEFAVNPSISRDGSVVASGRVRSYNPRVVVAQTYSMAEKKWTEHKEIGFGGAVAISPDGRKLAYVVYKERGTPAHIEILDRETGRESVSLAIGDYDGTLSWSPDGRQIAFDKKTDQSKPGQPPLFRPTIHVVDLERGKVSKIVNGRAPAWSPSGEWIAFLNYSPDQEDLSPGASTPEANQVAVVRPDGSGYRVLAALGVRRLFLGVLAPEQRLFRAAPVWSPDSSKLLLNELYDADKYTFSIQVLDFSTLRMTRKFKDVPPVFGWAEAR